MSEKKICCGIMICQMTAILSAVALLYLAVIVVIPSKEELAAGFGDDPVMCTTVLTRDITEGGKIKVPCDEFSCGEWCLSKLSSPCIQVHVMPRRKGAVLDLGNCTDIKEESCSALNVSLTAPMYCKKGQCKQLQGVYNCSKEGDNPCREVSAAYMCSAPGKFLDSNATDCSGDKCSKRLEGVYYCGNGDCRKRKWITSYKQCRRKCENLNLGDSNVVIFGKDKLLYAKCLSTASEDSEAVARMDSNWMWRNGRRVFLVSCTYIDQSGDSFHLEDCFNATLADSSFRMSKSYRELLSLADHAYSFEEWLIDPEESLRLRNDTMLKINTEGCVNTLMKECTAFFKAHSTDGRDGKTPDRYACFYSNKTAEYVIAKYNPELTYIFLITASVMPGSLFVLSCICLFICSKSVGVDDSGQLKVVLMKGGDVRPNAASDL